MANLILLFEFDFLKWMIHPQKIKKPYYMYKKYVNFDTK